MEEDYHTLHYGSLHCFIYNGMFLLFKTSPIFLFFRLIFVLKNIEDIRFNSFTCVTFKMDKLDKNHVISSYHFDPKKYKYSLSLSLSLSLSHSAK
jgi:hypothetical protein